MTVLDSLTRLPRLFGLTEGRGELLLVTDRYAHLINPAHAPFSPYAKRIGEIPFTLSDNEAYAVLASHTEGCIILGFKDSYLHSWRNRGLTEYNAAVLGELTWRNPDNGTFNWGGYNFSGSISDLVRV